MVASVDVILTAGRERVLARRHPWLLSGAVARLEGEPAPGAWACVRGAGGEALAWGHYSPRSSLRVRLLHFGKEDPGEELLEVRIEAAVARRRADPQLAGSDAVRLVNAEGDGLPGLVADRYGDVVVWKATSAGMDARRPRIGAALARATGAAVGYERADGAAARREGFAANQGPTWGDFEDAGIDPHAVPVDERGRRFAVDVVDGQKTGFYVDQRDARDLVERVARGRRVLDVFCYTGGFAVAAARGGARSVRAVDASEPALARVGPHVAANAPDCPLEVVRADGFRALRDVARSEAGAFDLVVLDPPPLARHRGDVPRASRAYKDAILHGLRALSRDGLLLAFACSHHVGGDALRRIAAGAAADAGRGVRTLARLAAPADHPVDLAHPEGDYLAGWLLQA